MPAAPPADAHPDSSFQAPPPYAEPYQDAGQPPRQPLFAAPPGPPVPEQPRPVRNRRGPGWIGTVAVGAGAAVLASLLTAGIIESRNDNTGSAAQPAPTPPTPSRSARPQPSPAHVFSHERRGPTIGR